MTILPAKRQTAAGEDKNESTQNASQERARREPHASSINDSSKSTTRRPFRRSATPEPTDHCLRKRFKESSKHSRRKQVRERKPNRTENPAEEALDSSSAPTASAPEIDDAADPAEASNNETEDATGFNSEDEYCTPLRNLNNLTDEEWASRDLIFDRCIAKLGYEIKHMIDDGACLFRAIADQIYGDQELHYMVRTSCMDYVVKNKDFFAAYVTEDFDKYIARKRKWNVHGNHLEIQAMSEMYNRTIEVYCYEIEPINIFNGQRINQDEPIRLSYHRMCHYNSISNPNNPSVGVGLGLPAYHTIDLNRVRMGDAVKASENLLIEQTMLEDKLKATDWEATNEAIEEEVARESYIQYFRDAEKRLKPQGHAASSSSTITSAVCSSPRPSSRRGSASPKGGMSPKGGSSPKGAGYSAICNALPSPRVADHCTSILSTASLRSSPRTSTPPVCPSSEYGSNSAATFAPNDFDFGHKSAPSQSPKGQPAIDFDRFNSYQFTEMKDTPESIPTTSKAPTDILNSGNILNDDWDNGIMAQVLAESRITYLDHLKRNSKKLGSPGPSTSR